MPLQFQIAVLSTAMRVAHPSRVYGTQILLAIDSAAAYTESGNPLDIPAPWAPALAERSCKRTRFVHGSILSSVRASSKPESIHSRWVSSTNACIQETVILFVQQPEGPA